MNRFFVAGLAIGIPLFVFLGAFRLFGPPDRWKNGPAGRPLPLAGSEPFAPSFTPPESITLATTTKPALESATNPDAFIKGFWLGHVAGPDDEAIQTFADEYAGWTKGQRLYARRTEWKEIPIPAGFTIHIHGFVNQNGRWPLLASNWRPWQPPTLQRLTRSVGDPEERPEYGLYLIDPDTGTFTYLFPGNDAAVSRDGRFALFERGRGASHELLVWEASTGAITTLAVLTERDPGSGRSFSWTWRTGEPVADIEGTAQELGSFRLVYRAETGTLQKVTRD